MSNSFERGKQIGQTVGNVTLGRDAIISLIIVFSAMRIEGIISWPWIWVLSPAWVQVLVAGIIAAVCEIRYQRTESKRECAEIIAGAERKVSHERNQTTR